jgi:hypothetical protein
MIPVRQICKNIFTGADNETYHMAKFSWAGSMIVICAVAVHRGWSGFDVDLLAMAGALVAVCTGHSAAIYGMKTTEPPHKEGDK